MSPSSSPRHAPLAPPTAATVSALERALGADRLRRGVSLGPFTTFQIGGPAALYYEARTADELARAITAARDTGVAFFLLGLGANILVGDGGYNGLVIHNHARHTRVDHGANRLWAESGAVVYPDLIDLAIRHELSGLEHYAGIPSTVGGALWQNLHFLSPPPERERTMFIEEVVHSAEMLMEDGSRETVGVDFFEFGYDQSRLHHTDEVVLSATFQLEPERAERLREIVEANLAWRGDRHPPLDTEPSAGSIFKKLEGIGAGRLIDECGLLGARIGGAEVTHRHANILINREGATASDVMGLIGYIQRTVEERLGHRLEPEISFIGTFHDPTPGEPRIMPKPEGVMTAAERAAARAEARDTLPTK
jgi:UDP-N-acetylmuramate dehydrogenase